MTENEKRIESINQEINRLQGEKDQLQGKRQEPSEEDKKHFRQSYKH